LPGFTVCVPGETLIPKSLTDAVPDAVFWKFVPATVSVPLLPIDGGFVGVVPVEAGTVAVTVMVTVAATDVVVVVPLVTVFDEFTVPRLHNTEVPAVTAHVPGLAVAVVIDEFAGSPMLSVNTAPVTGSLRL
jgi:hypothetical protein